MGREHNPMDSYFRSREKRVAGICKKCGRQIELCMEETLRDNVCKKCGGIVFGADGQAKLA
jgi:DNA-directed RNA polymerase subunit RPC12/RpoP